MKKSVKSAQRAVSIQDCSHGSRVRSLREPVARSFVLFDLNPEHPEVHNDYVRGLARPGYL
ncbi:hypothetical protein WMF26_32030 [Sorangium sp. So ce185]|uniref:hypothetical protein n=1 Tax=Sorangium sp. So ce185 TaxID=3133287 RepID=UPI003F5F4371